MAIAAPYRISVRQRRLAVPLPLPAPSTPYRVPSIFCLPKLAHFPPARNSVNDDPPKLASPQILTAPSSPLPPIETNARQSITDAAGNPPKIHHQWTNIQFILSHQKSNEAHLSGPAHRIEGQNLTLLSPISDFPHRATKSPLRISPSDLASVQLNCKDKKTNPSLEPAHDPAIAIRDTQSLCVSAPRRDPSPFPLSPQDTRPPDTKTPSQSLA